MNKKQTIILLSSVLILIVAFAYLGYDYLTQKYHPETPVEDEAAQGAQEKTAAPDFTVYDKDRNAVDFSDIKGKPILLNFWASWCSPCRNEMPHFDEAYKEYQDDIAFMMVDLVDGSAETEKTGFSFIEENGYSFPVYFDSDQSAAMAYGISSIPVTVLIDKDGFIITGQLGGMDEETLGRYIALLLEKE